MNTYPTPTALRIGPWTITPIVEAIGPFLDARTVFPHIDPPDLTAMLERHGNRYTDPDRHQLTVASQSYLIRGNGRTLLVDTCSGGPKPHRSPPFPGFVSPWLSRLAAQGVSPPDIDLVLFTHLHHDHIGWNTTLDPDGTLRPTFPHARYLVAEAEYEPAAALARTTPRGGPSEHIHDSIAPIAAAGQLDIAGPALAIDDGIQLLAAPGHTPGHSIVQINAAERIILIVGDLVHHPLQIDNPSISTAMCTDPQTAASTRAQLLTRAADTQAILLASHLPVPLQVRTHRGAPGFEHHELLDEPPPHPPTAGSSAHTALHNRP